MTIEEAKKAREALRKRKLDAEHDHFLRTWKGPLTEEARKKLRPDDRVWVAYGYDEAHSTTHGILLQPESAWLMGGNRLFLHEDEAKAAAHDLWLADRRANQMKAIDDEQDKQLLPDDETWTFCVNGPVKADCRITRVGCFFAEKAARVAWLAEMRSHQMEPISKEQGERIDPQELVWYASNGVAQEDRLIVVFPSLEKGQLYFSQKATQAALDKAKSVESHETPVGETQGKEVVTGDTRCKICMGVIGAIHAAACSAGADMLDEQDEKRLHELFDRQEKETVAKSDEQDPEPVKWLERKSDEHVQKGDDITWNRSVGINDACAFQHAHDGWTPLTSDPDKFPEPVGYEYTGLTLRSRYLTPEWKAWQARQDANVSNKEHVAPVEFTPPNASESAKASNKPTTVRGWLETIPDQAIRDAALRQCINQEMKITSLPLSLENICGWSGTKEGFEFWNSCYESAEDGTPWPPYPPKAKQEADGWTQEEIDKAAFKPDAVSHPSHYTSHPSGVECITITKHMNFCRGNAVKYLWRAGQKGDTLDKEIEDIAKAEEYCRIEKERLIALKGAK